MLKHEVQISLMQLKDAAAKVLKKESPFALSEMFSIELKFTIDLLVSWLNKTHKSRFLEIDTLTKQKFDKKINSIL